MVVSLKWRLLRVASWASCAQGETGDQWCTASSSLRAGRHQGERPLRSATQTPPHWKATAGWGPTDRARPPRRDRGTAASPPTPQFQPLTPRGAGMASTPRHSLIGSSSPASAKRAAMRVPRPAVSGLDSSSLVTAWARISRASSSMLRPHLPRRIRRPDLHDPISWVSKPSNAHPGRPPHRNRSYRGMWGRSWNKESGSGQPLI